MESKRSLDDIIRSFDACCEILKRCLDPEVNGVRNILDRAVNLITKAAKKKKEKRNKQKKRRQKLKGPGMRLEMMKMMMMIWIIVMVRNTFWVMFMQGSRQNSKWNIDKDYGNTLLTMTADG